MCINNPNVIIFQYGKKNKLIQEDQIQEIYFKQMTLYAVPYSMTVINII